MTKEYIERDYVIREACSEICGCEPNECEFDKPCAIVDRYKNWPAADVRENVKARWEEDILDGLPGYRPVVIVCSNCHRLSYAGFPYCPNCGAKMDGKGSDV